MVWISHIFGLTALCSLTAAYGQPGSSPNEAKNETSVSFYDQKTYTSTSLKPANTEKAMAYKMGQKDNKEDGGVKKEQKDYDGGNKKGGDAKKEQKDYDGGNKKEGDVKDDKNKNKDDVKKDANKEGGYGSGYMNWNQEYDDCVQQCKAKSPSPSEKPEVKAKGGKTHTVIVAPTQGVLRYVPFAVKPSPGDTVKFMWGANNHTVTKSSALLPCNKTLDGTFASGTQNKDFVYDLVVNDTQPIYIYCATPTHCQKGMFAMINPPSNINGSTSVGNMLPSIIGNDSEVAAYSEYSYSQTNGSEFAAKWGSDIDMAALPEWSHPLVAQNVLYTRSFLGNNVETIKEDGSIDLSGAGSTPLAIPKNVAAVVSPPNATTSTGTPNPGMYPPSDPAPRSDPTGSSSLMMSGGYASSASKALVLGAVAFIVSSIVV